MMKSLSLAACFLLLLSFFARAQSPITPYYEGFEDADTLPERWTDESLLPNVWVVNDVYEGPGGATPAQPADIKDGPNGNYLHIASPADLGALNAEYDPAVQTYSTVTSSKINLYQSQDVEISFWYLCNGAPSDFGFVEARTERDGEWIRITDDFSGVTEWTKETISSPDGYFDFTEIQLRFVWQNNGDGEGGQPAFAVDDIQISATQPARQLLLLPSPEFLNFCSTDSFSVDVITFGEFDEGDVVEVQFSDENNEFGDAPYVGGSIVIPPGAQAVTVTVGAPEDLVPGQFYRIRAALRGEELTSAPERFRALPPSSGGFASAEREQICFGENAVFTLEDYTGEVEWEQSFDGENFMVVSAGDFFVSDPLTRSSFFRAKVSNGACAPAFSNIVYIDVRDTPSPGFMLADPEQFCEPSSITLTLAGYSPEADIQWQASSDGGNSFADIPGATGPEYVTEPVAQELCFRAGVSNEFCPTKHYSPAQCFAPGVEVFVEYQPVMPTPGDTVYFLVTASGVDGMADVYFTPSADDETAEPVLFDPDNQPLIYKHVYEEPGLYAFKFEVEAQGGCAGEIEGLVEVVDFAVEIDTVPFRVVCSELESEVLLQTFGAAEPENEFVVEISVSEIFEDPIEIGRGAESPIAVTLPGDLPGGEYVLRVRATQSENASAFWGEILRINLPVAAGNLAVSPERLCSPDTARLQFVAEEPETFLEWFRSSDGETFEQIENFHQSEFREFVASDAWYYVQSSLPDGGECPPGVSDTAYVQVGAELSCAVSPETGLVNETEFSFGVLLPEGFGPFDLAADLGGRQREALSVEETTFSFNETFDETGEFAYSITADNNAGCVISCEGTFTVEAPAEAELVFEEIADGQRSFCPGDEFAAELAFAEGAPDAGNIYAVELSDANGGFDAPVQIGQLASEDAPAILQCVIPADAAAGNGYRLRATTTAPELAVLFESTITINENPPKAEILQDGETIFIGAAAAEYQWYFEGEPIDGATESSHEPAANGDYYVVLRNEAGCETASDPFNVTFVSRKELETIRSARVYPNPADARLNIEAQFPYDYQVRLTLYDVMGRAVMRKDYTLASDWLETSLDLRELSSGVYYAELKTGEAKKVVKVVKR